MYFLLFLLTGLCRSFTRSLLSIGKPDPAYILTPKGRLLPIRRNTTRPCLFVARSIFFYFTGNTYCLSGVAFRYYAAGRAPEYRGRFAVVLQVHLC
jgi:hypothetical protein